MNIKEYKINREHIEGLDKIVDTADKWFEALDKITMHDINYNSELYDVEKDKQGYIITDEDLKTNIEGVYAVGDVRQKKIRQIITACSDGAIASINCANYINAY